jgi:hypothetical protein
MTCIVRMIVVLGTAGMLAACGEDGGASRATHQPTEATLTGDPSAADSTPTDFVVADPTGASLDPACIDDYHGNQARRAALELPFDTTDAASVVLGDGFVAGAAELGGDALVVCAAAASDFFRLRAQCPGYLAIEVRTLEGGVPELLLYDDTGRPIEQVVGDWSGFFLKPLQRTIEAGTHVIEVRHSGGGAERYSLAVIVLPDSPCP